MMTGLISCCAGIVLYNPNIERLIKSLTLISPQVKEVVAVDNGSSNIMQLLVELSPFSNLKIFRNTENLGIATALNQIFEYAETQSYKWVFTLDQDTICPSNIISSLLEMSHLLNIGILCPAVEYSSGHTSKRGDKTVNYEEVYACMTSASLTSVEAWKTVGGYNESYFIDYVDNEFCIKLQLAGFKIIRVFSCSIKHELGNLRTIKIFNKKISGSFHNPVRCYYMMRNNVIFIKEYISHLQLIKEIGKMAKVSLREIFFSPNKIKTIKFLVKGVNDGLHGVKGKYLKSQDRILI